MTVNKIDRSVDRWMDDWMNDSDGWRDTYMMDEWVSNTCLCRWMAGWFIIMDKCIYFE